MSQPLICIKNLSFGYSSSLVLDKINLDIQAGEYIGIVGANGGGKTTLIKLILGIIKDSKKAIIIPKGVRFGYIPQRLSSTGIDFPARVSEILKNSFDKFDLNRYQELLTLCEIEDLEHRLLSELSGGERQKVFIAKSLIIQPDFLVLDEPTTGIDPNYQIIFWALLKKLNQQKKVGIIIISHDSHEILANANRLILIDQTVKKDSSPAVFGHFH